MPVLRHRHLVVLAIALGVAIVSRAGTHGGQAPASFAGRIAALSEPGGYFDTDNLISNEESYLEVLPDLGRAGLRGGAYIGVGPDQNFTYIAHLRPSIAFIVDVRRDNLLLHLLFKALFEASPTRVEYLAALFGRPAPPQPGTWTNASIQRLVAHVDGAAPDRAGAGARRTRMYTAIGRFGVPLSSEDLETIGRFHSRFIESGLSLRFQSAGRPPQSYYPDYRQLLLATDPLGRHGHYLASEDGYQFVRSLHAKDLIVPVVGNLNGPTALAAIGRLLDDRGDRLAAFYTSNVEFYLYRDGTFPRFVANIGRMPRTERAVIIRSVFGNAGFGRGSTSHVQPIDEFLARFSG